MEPEFPLHGERHPRNTFVGWLIGGRLKCSACAARWQQKNPESVPVHLQNIWPYSQQCEECKKLLVDGWKRSGSGEAGTGDPLNLFWEGLR